MTLSYRQMYERAFSLAATLDRVHPSPGSAPLTAVLAYRTPTAYTGILGALLRGHGYVSLSRLLPPERTLMMLERSGARCMVVDPESVPHLRSLIPRLKEPMVLLLPEQEDVAELAGEWPTHRILGRADLDVPRDWAPVPVEANAVAYLIFTSGSTGIPKAVMAAHRNALAYIDAVVDHYAVTEQDRFSQTFELTFDGSIFDLWVGWERGACLCVPTQKELIKPGKFIRDSRITIWFSVPSTGVFMRRLGILKPNRYPTLRHSLFGGEALPLEVARSWAQAASNSAVENLYGPTEVLCTCLRYRWDPERSPEECEQGVVPIGYPNAGMTTRVVDEGLREVAAGESGELLLSGPQVTLGYWRDPERTAASFITLPGEDVIFYRTGDRVRRPHDHGPILYLGRLDRQLQIHGHRVELGEVEAALREASGVDSVLAVGWPRGASGAAGGVEAFLGTVGADPELLRRKLAARLPDYMVPRRLHFLPELPLTHHGKIDQFALFKLLEEMA